MPKRAPQPLSFALACLALLLPAAAAIAAEWPTLRAGSELDFRPYCFTDANGQPTGLGPDLLKAVADKMGLRLQLTAAPWDAQWNKLVAGQLDVLPVVARTPGREPLVDFSLPHTETFDAFFVRKGQPPIHNIASAAGKSIVVLRQDAAHHQLTERKFVGQIIPVDSISEGLRLVAAGRHDALLCSKLIGTLECRQAGIKGVVSGPLIGDYKRTFSFAVPKGRTELLEKLNQGLLLVKTDGTYDQIYRRWLAVEEPWRRWVPYLQWVVALAAVLAALVIALQWLVRRRTRQLRQLTATLEQRVAQRTAELSQSQARYRTLLDVLPTAVYTCDAEGRITFFNERAAELWGRRPRLNETDERFCGAFRLRLPDGQPLPHAQTPMALAIREGASCRDQEVIIERPDGRRMHVLVNIDPLRDAAGRITGAVNAFTDITERKQTEQALLAAKADLEHANSAKDAFIAKLSHELRTPLTPVVASLSAIARDPHLPGNLREDMALLQRNIGLQVLLINDLLDVTRIVSGKLELRQQPVNVADIVHDVGRMLATDLEARAQRLVVSAPEPCWVRADASRLHQVFWNLIKNAIKFSPDHGQITVEMRSDATHTHIAVRDHGRGIDAADLPRLFRAFEQGASAHGFGGLGLGLAICRGIIEMHGGTIAAASQGLGHGATFTVTLPTCAAPADAAVPGALRPAVVDLRALRILLVEDHADTARMMTRLLQAEGHTVTSAPDVAAGVSAALTGDFHVLMSDLSLPDGTGYDLMRRITAAGKHLRGIAVSGHGSPADVQRSLEAGFIEHITKPVHFDALQQALLRVAAGATAHTSDRSSAHHARTG